MKKNYLIKIWPIYLLAKISIEILQVKQIKNINQLPNPSRNLDKITDILKDSESRVSLSFLRSDYSNSSKKSQNRFNYWANKLHSKLEEILIENGEFRK